MIESMISWRIRPIETNFNPSSNRSVDNVVTSFITIHLLSFANAQDNAGAVLLILQ